MIVQNMLDGDVVLVTSEQTKRQYEQLAREAGKAIHVIVIKEFHDLRSMNVPYRYNLPVSSRVHLDHILVYSEVNKVLRELEQTIESIQGERRVASNPMNVARLVRGA